jgi:hypothetical protein
MFVEQLEDASEWEDFVKVNPGGTFYHTLGWKDVIEKSFSLTALYLIIKNENRKLVGICPTFILARSNLRILSSLPHSDFGGPLIEKKYIREASLALRKYIEELSHKRGISFAEMCFLKDGNAESRARNFII